MTPQVCTETMYIINTSIYWEYDTLNTNVLFFLLILAHSWQNCFENLTVLLGKTASKRTIILGYYSKHTIISVNCLQNFLTLNILLLNCNDFLPFLHRTYWESATVLIMMTYCHLQTPYLTR